LLRERGSGSKSNSKNTITYDNYELSSMKPSTTVIDERNTK
jgi:hypothetical protein